MSSKKKEEKLKAEHEENLNSQEKETTQKQEDQEESVENQSSEEEKELTEVEKLQLELQKKEEELAKQKDAHLRLSAEFDNFRKRTMKEKAELILNGGEKCITSILPVVDDFERALTNMEKDEQGKAYKEGIELIYHKFIDILNKNGVSIIETKEKELNTDFHEAIAVIPAPSEELKGKILDCVQTGYTLNEKVIRHAKVVVGE